ncbi:hypothetical protein [Microbulbifer epialgicus]|uniref:Uncharacterized protein n=1 Tax=Microbulbifer epialgicus TaxID=393907 RepID=A0ABV4P3D1_9GAMM
MAHPIYKDLLEQWRKKATEIAGTSEGFTFYEPEFNEFLHWMFSQFQAFAESEQSAPVNSVIEFLNKVDELRDKYPQLWVDIHRTNATGWVAALHDKFMATNVLAYGQNLTAELACKDALEHLAKNSEITGTSND